MKMTIDELKHQIAEILDEAKKKPEKAEKLRRMAAQVEAYGFYAEEHDFSAPLGAYNLYRQQGAVNWGPMTSDGTHVDNNVGNPNAGSAAKYMRESEERALRNLVREVIENGLVDESSAWAPFLTAKEPIFESTWEEVVHRMNEAWYDDFKKGKKSASDMKKGGKQYDKTSYGHVKAHGQEKKDKKKSDKKSSGK
jgi:hypothetical protein